jgi:GNAT superfamily N-acetyltransferase
MPDKISIGILTEAEIPVIIQVVGSSGNPRKPEYYRQCLDEQDKQERIVLIARYGGCFAGQAHLIFQSKYPFFRDNRIPEINDLLVIPEYRKKGVATALMTDAESRLHGKFQSAGLGVGLYRDYGYAQKLYVKLGYVPDGNGVCYHNIAVVPGMSVTVDDDLLMYFIKTL